MIKHYRWHEALERWVPIPLGVTVEIWPGGVYIDGIRCSKSPEGYYLKVGEDQAEADEPNSQASYAEDPVNHPNHYTSHPSGIECIDVTRHMNFNLGNAMKYIWRSDLKDANIEDLKKAVWYLENEIDRLENL